MTMHDLIVIGGGPGGYLAAERAGQAGLDVVLFEKNKLGGVCLNEGCIPSKTLLNSAKVFEHASDGSVFGVTSENARIDQEAVIKRKNRVVRALVAGVKASMKQNNVTVVEKFAKITGKADGGYTVEADGTVYKAKNLIIASGSEAIVPPIPGVKEGYEAGYVLTNREILDLTEIPETMAIVGGGVIGLEMASYFQTVGTKVTVVEMLDHIAGTTDREISTILLKNYEKKGIVFHLNAKVVGVEAGKVIYEKDGETMECAADYTLMSIGRRAVTKDIGLESIGVYTERGAIVVDDVCLTNVPNVYAIGDCNAKIMLAHVAYRQAEVAVNTILGKKDTMRYNAVPSVIYTNPEVATVGPSEDELIEKGVKYRKVVLPMAYSGRYQAETNRGDGIIKLIADGEKDRLLACHLIGSYASEFVVAAGILIESELSIREIKEVIFPHPTVAEIIREAIFRLEELS